MFHSDTVYYRVYTKPLFSIKEINESIHREINLERIKHGLDILTWDNRIAKIALEKCLQMAKTDTTDHKGFTERVQHLRLIIFSISSCGENVASHIRRKSIAKTVVKMWFNSEGHHKNILGDYNQTGIATYRTPSGKYFFTQIFVKA